MREGYEIRTATIDDLGEVMKLNNNLYPAEWHVDEKRFNELISKSVESLILLTINNKVKGLMTVLPMSNETFDIKLKSGNPSVDMSDLKLNENNVCLFLGNILVDLNDPNRLGYLSILKTELQREVISYSKRKINISYIGTVSIDSVGDNFFASIGLGLVSSVENKKSFKGSPIDIIFS